MIGQSCRPLPTLRSNPQLRVQSVCGQMQPSHHRQNTLDSGFDMDQGDGSEVKNVKPY